MPGDRLSTHGETNNPWQRPPSSQPAASRFKSNAGLFYFGRIRRSDWLPRQAADGQQVDRTIDSESDDEEEMDLDANYHSSASGDSFDGEFGRLCMGRW